MNLIKFEGWKDCVEIKSGDFRLVVTTAVGPRILGGFIGDSEKNIFCVVPAQAGKTGGKAWKIYGGHRLWHSPEAKPRSYSVENKKIKFAELPDGGFQFTPANDDAGMHRSLTVHPLGGEKFRIEHRLRNDNMWDVEAAAWALSVMAAGGTVVVPQPQGDPMQLLPNRYLTVWPYTNMADPRLTWGKKFTIMKQSSRVAGKCKFGFNCEDGWLGYVNKGTAFVKTFEHMVDAEYPDNGCSIECFTNRFMLEAETLSPLYLLAPGDEIMHVEEWIGLSGVGEVKNEKDAEAFASKVQAKINEAPKAEKAVKAKKGKAK